MIKAEGKMIGSLQQYLVDATNKHILLFPLYLSLYYRTSNLGSTRTHFGAAMLQIPTRIQEPF